MIKASILARLSIVGAALLGLSSVAAAADHRVLYEFRGGSDGAYPLASLINIGHTLYGTTSGGGAAGDGTVFALTGGGEVVLHAFVGGSDGSTPTAGLTFMGGTLFGTTYLGGGSTGCGSGCGTVFSLSPVTAAEQIIYAFKGIPDNDGSYPLSGLLALHGTLYGTTLSGDDMGGNLFSVVPSAGSSLVLESLGYGGTYPEAALIDGGGTLYGTTAGDGPYGSCPTGACGTVYSWDPATGLTTAVYMFKDSPDGAHPEASLVYQGGRLYGTTFLGGAFGKGTVFVLDPATGVESILHSFQGGGDGAFPAANMIAVGGALYGTTSQGGGASGCTAVGGCGTVFSISPGKALTVIYAFEGGRDGQTPQAGLLSVSGVLYGTTAYGGRAAECSNGGCGTVFSLTP